MTKRILNNSDGTETVIYTCDYCGKESDRFNFSPPLEAERIELKIEGWTGRELLHDFCPECTCAIRANKQYHGSIFK